MMTTRKAIRKSIMTLNMKSLVGEEVIMDNLDSKILRKSNGFQPKYGSKRTPGSKRTISLTDYKW